MCVCMNKVLVSFLFVICLFITACHDDNDPEIYPIRFGQTDYTLRVGVGAGIDFVDGGGVYELTASNPDVLGKYYMDSETKKLRITPEAAGESDLTVTDVVMNTAVTLHFTVEDFYLSFRIDEIDGDNTNPYLSERNEIRFVRSGENTRLVKVMWQDNMTYGMKCIADGCFDIERSETNIFTLHMALHSHAGEELEEFLYTLGGDAEYLTLFKLYFGFDWDRGIASRSLPVRQIRMIMTDVADGCKITCTLQPF